MRGLVVDQAWRIAGSGIGYCVPEISGLFLADKKNPNRDPNEALRLLRIAADAGVPAAALRIGVMYAEGDGTPKNDIEAIKWLRADTQLRTIGVFQRVTKFTDKPLP